MTTEQNSDTINRRGFLACGGTAAVLAGLATAQAGAQDAAAPAAEKKLRVAVLSQWHPHAKGYAKSLSSMPEVDITAVWDEDPKRGEAWAKQLKAPFEADLAVLLKRGDVDAVCVNAPTSMHPEIMIAAAKVGKHIFTEKVMALTVAECDKISAAVSDAGVKFCISFPFRTRVETLYAKKAVEEGLLGKLTFIRVRVAHDGGCGGWLPEHFWDPATCGGGAMMDLGAHPMYLLRWLGGQPKRVVSAFSSLLGKPVEDNAVSVIEFENACLGVAETSFVSTRSPFSLELSGTEGSLLVGGPEEQSVRICSNKLDDKSWHTPADIPAAGPNPLRLWVEALVKNGPIPFGTEDGTQLTELMENAYIAAREKRQVEIPPRQAV